MAIAHVALGANLGDPTAQVLWAMDALDASPGMRVVARSALYQTPPWGVLEQPPFINAVVAMETSYSPRGVLERLMQLETIGGRVRDGMRWGPRALDLDLLVYGQQVLREPDLELPHPRIAERAFVLLPLADIAPDLLIPGLGRVRQLLADVDSGGCQIV